MTDLTLASKTYETINSDAVTDFPGALKQASPDKKAYFILDRKPYNRSEKTFVQAEKLNININLLSLHNPKLNPIKRCWKVMNELVRNNVFFRSVPELKSDINVFFEPT